MRQLLVVIFISLNCLAMEYSISVEREFYRVSLELAHLMARQENAIQRANDHDEANNSWMAGHALNDWHKENGERERLQREGRELAEKLPREVAEQICRQAMFNASRSTW